MIHIERLWLCAAPVDMRAGAERLLACVVNSVGAAHAHHGYWSLASNTMRTARSITSGENFGDFLILAPFSIEGASSKSGAVHVVARWGLHNRDRQSAVALSRFESLTRAARGRKLQLFPLCE